MNLFISFSARKDGNCDQLAKFLAKNGDKIIYYRDLNAHGCANCNYECFAGNCKYQSDDIWQKANDYQKIILLVPMYCGNPSSLYFAFNERSQDYFMHNEDKYENVLKKLFVIGIYGSKEQSPDFLSCFEKWFAGSKYSNHVLGIERHKYNLQLNDSVLNVDEIRSSASQFINPTKATEELSAMAVVLFEDKILATKEMIYGKETLSLPKGHKEECETLVQTAIRECFEETNVVIGEENLVKELAHFSYEFLTPPNKFIRKTIVPFLFQVTRQGYPLAKESRMISVGWMDKKEFVSQCTHANVKEVVQGI